MHWKKLLVSTLVGAVVVALLGWMFSFFSQYRDSPELANGTKPSATSQPADWVALNLGYSQLLLANAIDLYSVVGDARQEKLTGPALEITDQLRQPLDSNISALRNWKTLYSADTSDAQLLPGAQSLSVDEDASRLTVNNQFLANKEFGSEMRRLLADFDVISKVYAHRPLDGSLTIQASVLESLYSSVRVQAGRLPKG